VPGRLDEAILQSLRRDPDSRFRSAEAMSVAIGAATEESRISGEAETRVVRTPAAAAAPTPARAGYVPPPAPPPPVAAPRAAPSRAPVRAAAPRQRRGGGGAWNLIGTLLILGVATLVVLVVVVPLLELGRQGGGASPSASAAATPEPGSTVVIVPDLVGMSTDDAIDAARASRLDWTLYCNEDPSRAEGIIDQEPPAGREVAPGSTFSLYSARVEDCR
jgi:hypothetical protein